MTPRERLLTAISGGQPDRVPVTLFLADQGHFLNQMYPHISPEEHLQLQLKVIELQKQLGCDVFVRVLYGLMEPLSIIYGGLDVSHQTDTWQVTTEEFREGPTTIRRSTIRTPRGTLTQDFSIKATRAGKAGGGGFLLQPVDFLEYGTPEKNVEAYVATALAHADY